MLTICCGAVELSSTVQLHNNYEILWKLWMTKHFVPVYRWIKSFQFVGWGRLHCGSCLKAQEDVLNCEGALVICNSLKSVLHQYIFVYSGHGSFLQSSMHGRINTGQSNTLQSMSEKSFPNSNCLQVVARPQYAVGILITLWPDPKRWQGSCKAIPSLSQLVQFIWIPYLSWGGLKTLQCHAMSI